MRNPEVAGSNPAPGIMSSKGSNKGGQDWKEVASGICKGIILGTVLVAGAYLTINPLVLTGPLSSFLGHLFGLTLIITVIFAVAFARMLVEEVINRKDQLDVLLRVFVGLLLTLDFLSLLLSALWLKLASADASPDRFLENILSIPISTAILTLFIAIGGPAVLFKRLEIFKEVISESFAWREAIFYSGTLSFFLLSILLGIASKHSTQIIGGSILFGLLYYIMSGVLLPIIIRAK